ncbi:phage shock protein PspA [Paraglaciecola chathamensis]|jgi:phage shock protein A|uniref:Membrane-associated 30 kDa protein, chloroplastic n=2 Tax=Paraglaciecola chathamensis TaxID=368405 RepID=A0ABQ0I4C8_9ALTE|nr:MULTISPECIES: phage shock protein PspA [Paraglaciecola]MBU3020100.1 phage shock protein PspA [Paraglaciecola agarilytica]GAC04203.1 membrane-associated 30 kDa protein, chloroplastic [Paraglaciecola agarilytica NO2]GAC09666.1 membrane-associated 30 kDa protein, chloroplastic [Paraglaciecola chathamensis S18K6]
MGLFTRMSDIVQSNINALLDKAEDPEKMIKHLILEMQDTLVEVRSVAATVLADKKQIERRIDKLEIESTNWQNKAQIALQKDREDLARAALGEKQRVAQALDGLYEQLNEVKEAIGKLQSDSSQLNDKLLEAKAKQKTLMIKQRTQSTRLKLRSSDAYSKVDTAIVKFDQYERRIDDLEAQVDAFDLVSETKSLDAELAELEANDEIEKQLTELRKKVA